MLVQTSCCEPVRLSMDVVLYCAGLGMVRGRILEVDELGMIVDTGRVRLPVAAGVQAYVSQGPRRGGLRFSARTEARQGLDRGVRFMRLAPGDLEQLTKLTQNDAWY